MIELAGENTPKLAYGVKEAAEAVGLSKSKIWEEVKDGRIRSFKIGVRRLIAAEDLMAWINSHRNGK